MSRQNHFLLNRISLLLLLLLAVIAPVDAFVPLQTNFQRRHDSMVHSMAITDLPPPTLAVEKTVTLATTSATITSTTPSVISSNLPAQKELLEKVTGSTTTMISAATTATPSTPSTTTSAKQSTPPAPTKAATNTNTATGVRIVEIYYDGKVPKTEADEYVVIENNSKSTQDISGYYIYVATSGTQGATFTFPKGATIAPGKSIRIYTNEIHKETGGYSFGSGKAIWNNKGGLAVLKDSNGKKLGEYKYVGK